MSKSSCASERAGSGLPLIHLSRLLRAPVVARPGEAVGRVGDVIVRLRGEPSTSRPRNPRTGRPRRPVLRHQRASVLRAKFRTSAPHVGVRAAFSRAGRKARHCRDRRARQHVWPMPM